MRLSEKAKVNAVVVTETDSILDKYIKATPWRNCLTRPQENWSWWRYITNFGCFYSTTSGFADSGLIGQSYSNESNQLNNSYWRSNTGHTWFGATDNQADEAQSHIDKRLPCPGEPGYLQNQKVKVLKLSLRQQMLISSSETEKFDLGDALAPVHLLQ